MDDEDAARIEELKERLRKKMLGQLNMGVDPEIFYLGTQMAFMIVKHGARKFADYAKTMIDEMGDGIRKQLKTFYNGARDMMEASDNKLENEIARDMDDYDTVKKFNILSLSGETTEHATQPTVFEKADQVAGEQEAEQQKKFAEEKMKEQRNDGRKAQEEGVALDGTPLRPFADSDLDDAEAKFYYQGRRVFIMLVTRSGEQVSATKFSEPKVESLYLTNGKNVRPEEVMVADSEKQPSQETIEQRKARWQDESKNKSKKSSKSKKKNVSLQQRDLFSDVEPNNVDNGLQGNDELRTEGLPADDPDNRGQRVRSDGEGAGQESGRPDGRGKDASLGIVGHGNDVGLRSGKQLVSTPAVEPQGVTAPSERPSNPKNTHINHAERGKDYAPRGVDARIAANIRAIELMKQLMESGEQATPEQMAVLRQFSGWGGLGKAFDARGGFANRIRELLGEEAYEQANMSRNSAYYTPANVVDALWDVARAMGFKGGRVLEGSAGIGNILGLMPTDMSERSDIHAVEIDQTTGNILRLLYPDAQVDVQGFEATQIENGSVDLAITNVPFVTGLRVNDTTGDKDLSKKFHDIHDFCIAKNIRKLREGGIGIFITSSGTLDNSARLREWMIQEGGVDVVGAFRLNNETFGGTGATSDIIIVRKRVNGQKSPHAIDVLSTTGERTADFETGETKRVKGQEIPVVKHLSMDYNGYFVEHPEMMGGEMRFGFEKGDTFRPASKALYPAQGKNQEKMLTEWAQSFAEKDWENVAVAQQQTEQPAAYEELGEGVKEGSMVVSNGQLCIAQRGKAVPLAVNANKVKGHSKVECFEAYQMIKKALADLLEYQTSNDSDADLQPKLKALNKAYDDFVRTYGYLHKNTAISFLKSDVDFSNILALETYKELGDGKGGVTKTYGKTDIFTKRVVDREKSPEPKNVKDGIIASIYLHGRVDVPYISEQIGMSEADVRDEIIRQGLGFENPSTRQMEVSYEYLSGNVREKLRQARENNTDGRYDANIRALEAIVPMDIPAHLIDFSIGSSWIAPKLYEEFVKDMTDVEVTFTAAGGTWFMKTPYFVGEQKNRAMGVTSELLNKTIMGTQLIEAAMQNKSITVSETRKKWDGTTETIVDKEATQACANKIDEIRQAFKEWAREKMQSDPEMSGRIEATYNDMFNNYVPRSIPDEFVPKHFGGAATSVNGNPFMLKPHQGKAVIRGTMQPLLLAHEVGSGKTYTLISTAMEMRRLGIARKPMIVVQNATVGQFVESAKELYPNAKVLTIEEADRTTEGRKNFYAKIKYNDWDMIVVPQSVFERIPDSEERQMKFVQDKIEEKMLVLDQMKDAAPDSQSIIVRQAEKDIDKLKDELAELTDAISSKRKERDEKKEAVTRQNAGVKAMEMLDRQTDDVENFDDMGIDAILVDEAHEYKHLGFATAMQRGVKGVDPSYSKKAQGVYLKTQAVLEKNNGRNVVFATGTPISNTAAEIWTFMRYLMPADTMKEYGIYYFDDFVRNFGNLQQMLEFTTSGKFKENNRFAGYVNLPELVRIWSGVADTVLNEDIEADRIKRGEEAKIPETEGGKATDLYLPQTKALRSVMKYVKAKLKEYDEMSGKEKKENSHIPLTMYGTAVI